MKGRKRETSNLVVNVIHGINVIRKYSGEIASYVEHLE